MMKTPQDKATTAKPADEATSAESASFAGCAAPAENTSLAGSTSPAESASLAGSTLSAESASLAGNALSVESTSPASATTGAELAQKGVSMWSDAWYRLRKNRMALLGLYVLVFMIVVVLLTPWIAPYGYEEQNLALGASPPGAAHWLGTDVLGRDMLTRIMYGGRVSLMVGAVATAVALVIGVLYGAIAGYVGGRVDAVMMRLVDILYALPFIIFIILLMVIFGRNILLLFLAIGAVEWLTMARIVRGQVLALRQREFIEAAISIGLSGRAIILRHIIPNTLGPVIVYTTLTIPGVMLLEAFLSFLGLGIQPPQSSWGLLISYGVESMEEYPWLLIFPGLTLTITLFALNFLGDGLRDALDPHASKSR